MRIALDAMGGDYAPSVTIDGALDTISDFPDIHIILVGDESVLQQELKGKRYSSDRITLLHASQTVGMDESPSAAIRKKKDSSIRRESNLSRAVMRMLL
jgi:glycerol-3-phosphate acyltransferase PlsX